MTLDSLTRTVTAFVSWSDLTAHCRNGYVPSLRLGDANQARLGRALKGKGYNVFWLR